MTRKDRTFIFNICVGLFNIVLGLAIELILIAATFFLLHRFPNIGNSIPSNVLLPFVFIAGLFVAMYISAKTIAKVVRKFNLQEKVDPKAVTRYLNEGL